jgi:ribA/ribD-fused uncharacterized protein
MGRHGRKTVKHRGITTPPKTQLEAKLDIYGSKPHEEAESDGPLFFYMPNAKYGELCQWYPCTFTILKSEISQLVAQPLADSNNPDPEPNGAITFNCAEQFMMYCKAARFRDKETLLRVLASDSPKEQKRLGKLTSGFTDGSWDEVKSKVVETGNIAKFGQNEKLKRVLLSTGDRLLCEAASKDRVWGIGYTQKHAMEHERHWGENRLGKALMMVREHLRKEGARDKDPWE